MYFGKLYRAVGEALSPAHQEDLAPRACVRSLRSVLAFGAGFPFVRTAEWGQRWAWGSAVTKPLARTEEAFQSQASQMDSAVLTSRLDFRNQSLSYYGDRFPGPRVTA